MDASSVAPSKRHGSAFLVIERLDTLATATKKLGRNAGALVNNGCVSGPSMSCATPGRRMTITLSYRVCAEVSELAYRQHLPAYTLTRDRLLYIKREPTYLDSGRLICYRSSRGRCTLIVSREIILHLLSLCGGVRSVRRLLHLIAHCCKAWGGTAAWLRNKARVTCARIT